MSKEGGKGQDLLSQLPTPNQSSKTVGLCPELEAENIERIRDTTSLRSSIHCYAKENESQNPQSHKRSNRKHVKSKTPALGSEDHQVISTGNYGFFSAVLAAYNNHYTLRTCPEDWWYTIIRKIAVSIDENAKSDAVRKFFVSHEGKKKLEVEVGPSVYGVDYSWFLNQMSQQISQNINVPEYIDMLRADFSTTTPTHVIVSEITVMASVQEYFEYGMITFCGIPSLEMEGEKRDWIQLKEKLVKLKLLLEPIHDEVGLRMSWWNGVENICDELVKAYDGMPDTDWWSRIFSVKYAHESGESDTYDGWFISQLLDLGAIRSLEKLNNGVVTFPLTITNGQTGKSEESAFAGGIAGFNMFKENDSKWPSVKAAHGWVLMLEPDSEFREEMVQWESQLALGA